MKVLHISTMDFGGAAKGMLNLHYALLNAGIDSKILVAQKQNNDSNIFAIEQNLNLYPWSKFAFARLIQKCLRKLGIGLTKVDKIQRGLEAIPQSSRSSCFSSPITNYDLSGHPLVKEADIIHLHWIGNFVDIPSFFRAVDKPIVWTLRDENPGLGGFHYVVDKQAHYGAYKEYEDLFYEIKQECLANVSNMHLIALSDVMSDFIKQVPFLNVHPAHKIYNLIDSSDYCIIDKNIARTSLSIPSDAFVITFVSVLLKDYRKGLNVLMEALGQRQEPCYVICVGQNDYFENAPDNVICVGPIESTRILSLMYSAADVFITPSCQESFGKTTIESLLCGTPVIASCAGVAPEIIKDNNGVLLADISPAGINTAIDIVQSHTYDSRSIRTEILSKMGRDLILEDHIELYRTAIRNSKS